MADQRQGVRPFQLGASLRNPAGKTPLAQQKVGSFNLWELRNGGGGWVHPIHLHMEEHRTLMRNGKVVPPATPAIPTTCRRKTPRRWTPVSR